MSNQTCLHPGRATMAVSPSAQTSANRPSLLCYCYRWRGVSCSTDAAPGTQQVQAIRLSSSTSGTAVLGLKGRLPPASSLKMLPGLMALHISGQPGVTGPLPDSWAHLLQLEDVRLHDNSLEGELPDSWAALKSLQVRGLAAALEQGMGGEWLGSMHGCTSISQQVLCMASADIACMPCVLCQ
eukprot:GHRQ01014222.1.p1 GENE.GHRQ01014222.1~~GHRQ01014222.1.p1  ORF type:complete len:183 (-),score=39.70 GHRQ01014222.1:74-622(-)